MFTTNCRMQFNRPITLVFRAYNDGVAYRFETAPRFYSYTKRNGHFPLFADAIVYYPEVQPRTDAIFFIPRLKKITALSQLDSMAQDSIAFTPVLIVATGCQKWW